MISYIKGDLLYSIDKGDVIVHCISRDARMGVGFAKSIVLLFKGLRNATYKNIQDNNLGIGDISIANIIGRNGTIRVINLITKDLYYNKPTYQSIRKSLEKMNYYCTSNKIVRIKIPKIGSGYDKLKWEKIEKIIDEIFIDVDIIVYEL